MIEINEEVKKVMPQFFKRIEKGEKFLYDPAGFTRDFSAENIAEIQRMKNEFGFDDVVAIIESNCEFDHGDICHMLCYVCIDDEECNEPWMLTDGSVGFMANVINTTWDIEEIGAIGLTEETGCVFRRN